MTESDVHGTVLAGFRAFASPYQTSLFVRFATQPLRQSEIGQLGAPIPRDQDVGRLDIAMQNTGGMGGGQTIRPLLTLISKPNSTSAKPTAPLIGAAER